MSPERHRIAARLATLLLLAACAEPTSPQTDAGSWTPDTASSAWPDTLAPDSDPDGITADVEQVDGSGPDAASTDAGTTDAGDPAAKPPANPFATEPNNTQAQAVPLPYGGGGRGKVGGSDPADWFVVKTHHKGELRVWVEPQGVVAKTLKIGADHYISVTASAAVTYTLLVDFRAAPVTISGHDPFVVGKQAAIQGAGFGDAAAMVAVTLGGTVAPVLSAKDTELVVTVPYGAKGGALSRLRVVTAGRTSAAKTVAISAPTYPSTSFSGGTPHQESGVSWLGGVISVVAGSSVTSDALLAAVKPLGLTAAGWSAVRNRHRLTGAPQDLAGLHALAAKLRVLPTITSATPIFFVTANNAKWATSPYFAHDNERRYRTVNATGLHDAWKLFETLGGDPKPPLPVVLIDTGVFDKVNSPCKTPPFEFFPPDTGAGGFTQHTFDGQSWNAVPYGQWKDLGDMTPTVCDEGYPASDDGSHGHGGMCVSIFGAAAPHSDAADRAIGAFAGFSRAGIDNGLPFSADVRIAQLATGVRLTLEVLTDAIWLVDLEDDNPAKVVSFSYGATFTGTVPSSPFALSEMLWVISAGYDITLAGDLWPVMHATGINHLVVGAVQSPGDNKQPYSNRGPLLDVVAPDEIFTHFAGPTHFTYVSGTSASTPLVVAYAALIRWLRPTLHVGTVAAIVRETGVDVASHGLWARGGAALPRVHWMKLLTDERLLKALKPEIRPLLLVADRKTSGGYLAAFPLDPQTGKTNGSPIKVAITGCVDPVDVQVAPDGSRAAVTCSKNNVVAVVSLHTFKVIGTVGLTGNVGSHNRTWMDPAGVLHVPEVLAGGAAIALVDVYGPELLAEKKVNDDKVPWTIAPLSHTGSTGVLISSNGNDPGRLTTYTPQSRKRQIDPPSDVAKFAPYYLGKYGSGLALSPDGQMLAASFSGSTSDVELVEVPVGTAAPSILPGKKFSMAMANTVLERPYDVAWWPDTGLSGVGLSSKTLFATSWANDRTVMMQRVGGAFPGAYETLATFKNNPKSNPERVSMLQSGRAVYVSEWKGNVGVLTLPISQGGANLPFTQKVSGFKRPVGVTTTPLISIAHPRHGVKVGRYVSPTYLLRDTTAVKVTCRVETPSGTVLHSQVTTPVGAETHVPPGFATCGPFDIGTGATVHLVVEVSSQLQGGHAPTYRARRVTSALAPAPP